ncbi:MAG TPA: hypothetical protein VEJ23_08535, partial [Solirubrobacteraceae bacterium]|nr:hypothetical protein [Solirubrobacteraceae bacterium]
REVRAPYEVYLNGVPQQLGVDFSVREGALEFERELRKDRISGWRDVAGGCRPEPRSGPGARRPPARA